ncbi:MAG: DNA gyrase subunit A [Clostridiales bacterium]|nr:DNA gyrase subunit A [Clostridiales bacterium]
MAQQIIPIDIVDELRQSYIDYAMSVIVARALPDARDGLKPVHRRILYAMYEAGRTPDKPYRKSSVTVGDVLAKYHPHGDAAVYEAMVRMAQDFSLRYPLVDGHGNMGSIDGDPPAAMRYTESRLSPLALELLRDIDKDTVDFQPNFDGIHEEPVVLPARFPNLLLNGADGIAVGMATKIPPHNLKELVAGTVALLENPDLSVEELMRYIPGPDFPTGGLIVGREAIREAYETGRAGLKVRARVHIEEAGGGRQQLVVTEIPYQVNKSRLIEQIAELVREKKLEGIVDLRDESDRTGMRVVIVLGRGVNPHVLLNRLYRETQLEITFGVILLAIVDGRPRQLSLKEALAIYLRHQVEVVTRRTRYLLQKALDRAHIVEGLLKALDHIDAIIDLIRASHTIEEARQGLMEAFSFSEKQANAILEMRLQRLTGLEREKLTGEYENLRKDIAYYHHLLEDPAALRGVIKEELEEIARRFGDDRRTTIVAHEDEKAPEDYVEDVPVVIPLTHAGYIKRVPLETYRTQSRGGRGKAGITTREEDFVEDLFVASTHDTLLFFTNQGRVYPLRAFEVPEASRQARGMALVNLIPILPGEKVTAALSARLEERDGFLFFATQKGKVKKTPIAEFRQIRRSGLRALALDPGDSLIGVRLIQEDQLILLATARGQAIAFSAADVRPMGRSARGVQGVRLAPGDQVIGMVAVEPGMDLLLVTEKGYGKRTALQEFRVQKRGGIGLKAARITPESGPLVAVRAVHPEDDVMVITARGMVIRLAADNVTRQGRPTRGVRLIRLDEGDAVVSVARVVKDEENGGR